jgi:hypothetical protein
MGDLAGGWFWCRVTPKEGGVPEVSTHPRQRPGVLTSQTQPLWYHVKIDLTFYFFILSYDTRKVSSGYYRFYFILMWSILENGMPTPMRFYILSCSISYWDLLKCLYFADTTEWGDRECKEAQRQGEREGYFKDKCIQLIN